MVALVLASIVMASIFLSYQAQVQGKLSQDTTLDIQQAARSGLDMISSDLRMAGCDPTGAGSIGFSDPNAIANPAEIRFSMDYLGGGTTGNESNGAIDVAGEDIRYAVSADGDLVRERFLNNASIEGEQVLVNNVDALNFVYLDADGAITAVLDDIRAVEVTLLVRSGDAGQQGMMRTWTDNNIYENQWGSEIFDPDGDRFRRLLLTTTAKCRNLVR
jgi:type IV pilus assembly protein PilW